MGRTPYGFAFVSAVLSLTTFSSLSQAEDIRTFELDSAVIVFAARPWVTKAEFDSAETVFAIIPGDHWMRLEPVDKAFLLTSGILSPLPRFEFLSHRADAHISLDSVESVFPGAISQWQSVDRNLRPDATSFVFPKGLEVER